MRGDCTEIVQFQCSHRAVFASFLQKSYGAVRLPCSGCRISYGYCTGTERQPCNNCVRAVRMSHDSTIYVRFFWSTCPRKIVRLLHDHRAASERCPCGDCSKMPVTTGLRFLKICITNYVQNRRCCGARVVYGCTKIPRRPPAPAQGPHGKGDTGVRAP